MTGNPLNCGRNSTLLWIQSGCSLSACPGSCLSIEALPSPVLRLMHLALHHRHLMTVSGRLRWIGWRRALLLLMIGVHAIVNWRSLVMRLRVVLSHLHRIRRLSSGLGLCLGCLSCLCGPLLTSGLCLLLLLYSRCDTLVERRELQVHGRDKWPSELLLSDKRMKFCLLRGPSFKRIDLQQPAHKVDKGNTVIDLCLLLVDGQ